MSFVHVMLPSAVTLTWLTDFFDLISMSQAQVYTWPNFGEISSNIYLYIVFTRGALHSKTGRDRSRHLLLWLVERRDRSWFWRPVVNLQRGPGFRVTAFGDLDLWPNQRIYEPKYICDQNWVKFHPLFFWDMVFAKFARHCLLWPWPFASESNLWPKLGDIFFIDFEVWCSQSFRHAQTHSLTHSRADRPNTACLRHRFFQRGGGTNEKRATTRD